MAEKIETEGKEFTPTSLKKRMPNFPRTLPRILEEETSKAPEPKIFKKKCKVCGGDITEKIVQRFDAKTGPMIIGPGSRSQFHHVFEGYYCKQCGLKYEFVPGEKQQKEE